MGDTLVSAYRMNPSGTMVLASVDPEEVSVLDDVEEMERMLNEGYTVYIDQETLEREWEDR